MLKLPPLKGLRLSYLLIRYIIFCRYEVVKYIVSTPILFHKAFQLYLRTTAECEPNDCFRHIDAGYYVNMVYRFIL